MQRKIKIYVVLLITVFLIFLYKINNIIEEMVGKQNFSVEFIKKNEDVLTELVFDENQLEILNSFKRINSKDYNVEFYKVVENLRSIINTENGRSLSIYILEELLLSKELSNENVVYVLGKLNSLKKSKQNLIEAIKYNLEYIKLAKYLNNEYDVDKGKISLSTIISELGGYKAANNILYSVIENEDKNNNFVDENRLIILAYLNIIENSLEMRDYTNALIGLDEIKKRAELEEESYRNNLYILLYSLSSEAYTHLNQKEKAYVYLRLSEEYLKRSQKVYFIDENLYYNFAKDRYNLKFDIESFTEQDRKNILEYIKSKRDVRFLYGGYNLLFEYYKKTGDFQKYDELKKQYDKKVNMLNELNYEILSLYMIDTMETGIINRENQKLLYIKARMYLYLAILLFLVCFSIKQIYKLNKLNTKDSLTKINNRKAFDYNMKRLKNKEFFLLLFDLDNFKNINDTYGHSLGDQVLIKIGAMLLEKETKELKPYRIGGEEFAIIFEKQKINFEKIIEISENIREEIEKTNWENNLKVTISGGLSYKSEDIFNICDKLLYKAKNSGKNKILHNIFLLKKEN